MTCLRYAGFPWAWPVTLALEGDGGESMVKRAAKKGRAKGKARKEPVTGRVDLREVFLRVQEQMVANLASSDVFQTPGSCGAASEQHWIDLLNRYLPRRYHATSAFILDADGQRSRQIDIAIYDHFYSPLFFHNESQPYIPAESVYAVFEVKQTLTSKWILDAASKAASVRCLRRTSAPVQCAGSLYPPKAPGRILAGILTLDSVWATPFVERMPTWLQRLDSERRLDLGCCLRHAAFEMADGDSGVRFSQPREALMYFMLRLIERLQQTGASPAVDLREYGRCLG